MVCSTHHFETSPLCLDKSREYEGWFNSGIPCFAKNCEVSRCHARGTSFLFSETEVLLDEFFEPNETILLFQHPKGHSTISRNQFTNYFDRVRCSNGCWSSTAFISEIFTAVPKSCTPFKNPCTRESIVTISLLYQLESFSSCFARLETKT
jgi:hypothetical protein